MICYICVYILYTISTIVTNAKAYFFWCFPFAHVRKYCIANANFIFCYRINSKDQMLDKLVTFS